MAIVIPDIRMSLDDGEEAVFEKAKKILNISSSQIKRMYIAKSSVDARKKDNISIVYSVGAELRAGEKEIAQKLSDKKVTLKKEAEINIKYGTEKLSSSPVVVGFGPAGMFAGLILARNGYAPVIIERGGSIEERSEAVKRFWTSGKLDINSNVQFGEGGAGSFSDGKLTTRIGDERCRYVLEDFVKFGAPKDILYKANPHIGTDLLRDVVKNIRKEIEGLGGKVIFNSKAEKIIIKNGKVTGIRCKGENIDSSAVLLCIGHSARDTFETMYQTGIAMQNKPFSVGVRIEHLQEEVNTALYGKFAGHAKLGNAEYKFSKRYGDGRAAYTFCMCPGGYVVAAASEENGVVTNGMSERARNGNNANAALVVSVDSRDFGEGILDGVEFQRKIEHNGYVLGGGNYKAPAETVGNFLAGEKRYSLGKVAPTYPLGINETDISKGLPEKIIYALKDGIKTFEGKMRGFSDPYAILTGYETRTSSPIRILRGETGVSLNTDGLYPCGEGAGYAGGIMSAAVDGIRAAISLMERYAPRG